MNYDDDSDTASLKTFAYTFQATEQHDTSHYFQTWWILLS